MLVDTHVVVWLFDDPKRLIPAPVRIRLEREALALSPFVRLELQYLREAGKLETPHHKIIDELTSRLEIAVTDPPSALVCRAAESLTWTRDPFDRLICGHAVATATPLVTKDRHIREHLPLAWWANGAATGD